MKPAEIALSKDLDKLSINTPAFPVIANFTAQPSTTAEDIRQNLKSQVCGRVRWVETVQNATSSFGAKTAVEFGAGNVLTGLAKRIDSSLERINIYSGAESA
jgi:[acyl-carrier-protein] S-malonyltransferase